MINLLVQNPGGNDDGLVYNEDSLLGILRKYGNIGVREVSVRQIDEDFIDQHGLVNNDDDEGLVITSFKTHFEKVLQAQKEEQDLILGMCNLSTGDDVLTGFYVREEQEFWIKMCSSDRNNTVHPHVFDTVKDHYLHEPYPIFDVENHNTNGYIDEEILNKEQEYLLDSSDQMKMDNKPLHSLTFLVDGGVTKKDLKEYINKIMQNELVDSIYFTVYDNDGNDGSTGSPKSVSG